MSRKVLGVVLLIAVTASLAFTQTKLWPLREGMRVEKSPDDPNHLIFVAEKQDKYKLKLEYPTTDHADFVGDSKAKVALFWLRVENLSKNSLNLDIAKFTLKDAAGKTYTRLEPEEAMNRILDGRGITKKLVGKSLGVASLGKAGAKPDDQRDEGLRFSLRSAPLPEYGVAQGLLYFEAPQDKNYTLHLGLGELWSQPFPFSSEKPRR